MNDMADRKILVVDDSATDRTNLHGILTDEGCTVITACSGREALHKARMERPHLIFMDIVMEDMDGYEATRRLTQHDDTKGIPVVFVSSKRQKADRVWAMMQGGRDLISKPFRREQIIAQLRVDG